MSNKSSKSQQSSTISQSKTGKDKSGDLSPRGNGGKLKSNGNSGLGGGDKSGDLSGGDKSGDLSPRGNGGKLKSNGNGGLGGNDNSGDLSGGDKSGDLSPRGNGGKPKSNGNGGNSGWLGGNGGSGNVPPQLPPDRLILGTACNDTLTGGNSGRDTLVGTPVRGVGEQDTLIGGGARDTFVLGDARGSFYVGNGDADYAKIQNFNRCDDVIKLSGSAQDYSISYTNGVASIYQNSSCDLIAKIDAPCSPLDLTASYFQYVAQSSCGGQG